MQDNFDKCLALIEKRRGALSEAERVKAKHNWHQYAYYEYEPGADLVMLDLTIELRDPKRTYRLARDAASLVGYPYIGSKPINVERFIAKFTMQRENFYRFNYMSDEVVNKLIYNAGIVMEEAIEMARNAKRS